MGRGPGRGDSPVACREVALVICLPRGVGCGGFGPTWGSGHEKTLDNPDGSYEGRASTQLLCLGVDAPGKYENERELHVGDVNGESAG